MSVLFAVKRRAGPALATAVAFLVVSAGARRALGIAWSLDLDAAVVGFALAGWSAIVLSDGVLHLALSRSLGAAYDGRFEAFVESFSHQTAGTIAAAGLLAGTEELLFRGVVVAGLVQRYGVGSALAVLVAALLFGLAHSAPDRRLRPFVVWAVWEGVLLGTVFVVSGSLLAVVLVHVGHDVAGFWAFARWRARGRRATARRR